MPHNPFVQDCFGRRYKVHLIGDGPVPKHLKPESFYDILSTRKFIDNLNVSKRYWSQLSNKLVGNLPYTANEQDNHDAVARLLLQGKIRFFKIGTTHAAKSDKGGRSFKQPDGSAYLFISPVDRFLNPNSQTKKFNSKQDAIAFITQLCPEEKKILDLALALNFPVSSHLPNEEIGQLYTSMGEMVFDERLHIISLKPSKPPVVKPEYEDVESKPVTLGPESKEEWFSLTLMRELDDGTIARMQTSISLSIKNQREKSTNSDENGKAQVGISGGNGSFEVEEMSFGDDLCYEFISLS